MTFSELAKQLRKRQLEMRLVPPELINACTNEDIIDSYFECAKCQKNVFAEKAQFNIIKQSKSVDELVERINMGLKWRNKVVHIAN